MSLRAKFVLLTLCATWIAASPVMAEVVHENELFPEFCPEDLNFRWFEPIYCDCGDERPLANNGFFFSYERYKANVSRAKQAEGSQFGDWTDGNIFDFGYMREADYRGQASGWSVSVLKMDNPNLFVLNENIDRNGTILVDLQGNPIGDTYEQLNAFNVYGIEINRVWRMEPTFHGAILEPFVGVRYNRIRDHFGRAEYDLFSPAIPTVGPANGVLSFPEFDTYLTRETFTDNDLYGGQIGLRAFKRRGRWRLGTEVRGFTFHNYAERTIRAELQGNDRTVFALYDENGTLTAIANGPLTGTIEVSETNDIKNRFSWGGELRLDLGFDISKKFSIELGGVFLAFVDGIGRGDLNEVGQSFLSAGATLGFAINR